jgi:hypothetical protein
MVGHQIGDKLGAFTRFTQQNTQGTVWSGVLAAHWPHEPEMKC